LERRAARHALSQRRLDSAPGRASCARQSHERLYALQVGTDRRHAGDQDVRRERLGEDAGDACADRDVAGSADGAPPALGDAAARDGSRRFRPHDQTSRVGHTVPRRDARPVRLARPSSYGARHVAAAADGMGTLMVDFADDDLDEEFPLGDGTADTEGIVMCPYCGEPNEIGIDAGGGANQDYVEDCQVCCRPWRVTVVYDDEGSAQISASPLDE